MTVDNILAQARNQTKTNTSQVSASNALLWLNIVYHETLAVIRSYVSEDFFFDMWVTDALADQINGEYTFPEQDTTNPGLEKLKRVEVKPASTDLYYKTARQVDVRSLPEGWDYYLQNQPAGDPIYFVADRSFFLAPNYTDDSAGDSGNEQIRLFGIKQAVDLASGGAEATILVPREYHGRVLALGIEKYIYSFLQKHQEATMAENKYRAALLQMASELSDRDISEGLMSLPDDAHLQ